MSQLFEEIKDQPRALSLTFEKIKQVYIPPLKELKQLIHEKKITRIIFSGMGSSYFAAFLPYYFLNQHGITAEIRETGEFLVHSFPKIETSSFERFLLFLISQSGESGEIIELLKKLNILKKKPIIVAITNNSKSTLAKNSNFNFIIEAGEEMSVTSKSYTCTLLMLYFISKSIIGMDPLNEKDIHEIMILLEIIDKFFLENDVMEKKYDEILSLFGLDIPCLEILGQGPSLSTAYQAALIYKEIVKSPSEANSISMFHHGGIECLHKNSKLVLLSSGKSSNAISERFIKNLNEKWEYGALLYITNEKLKDKSLLKHPRSKIKVFYHDITNEFLSPIKEIMILQLFFYRMAEKKRLEPGRLRFSQKVTPTL
ncbi:MAG: SIS domain-containing protein [Promethearchaeota archaeon]